MTNSKITLAEYLKDDPRRVELFQVWDYNSARRVHDFESCSLEIPQCLAPNKIVALKDLTEDEIFLLLPGHLRSTGAEELTISYEILDRLKKQLRRPHPMRVVALARIYANITKNWPPENCSVKTESAQGRVVVCWNGKRGL